MLCAAASVLGVHATTACCGCRNVWIRSIGRLLRIDPVIIPVPAMG
jgi:hypothetical protein